MDALQQAGITRLLVHSIQDDSARAYIKYLKDFFAFILEGTDPVRHVRDVDALLATYMDMLCYERHRHSNDAEKIISSVAWLFPEWRGSLPLAARSAKSWQTLVASREGGPICEEMVWLLALHWAALGMLDEMMWLLLQYDAYSREQDMRLLCAGDVVDDKISVAFRVGVADRGQSVKTGINQGVVLARGWVADLLMAFIAPLEPQAPVFALTPAAMNKAWQAAALALGWAPFPPLHSLRHSGPSEDLARSRRDLESIRRRGRWAALSSVQRYTKDFRLLEQRVKLTRDQAQAAQAFSEAPRAELARALRRAPAAKASRAPAYARALQKQRHLDKWEAVGRAGAPDSL